MTVRPIHELIDVDDPAWPILSEEIAAAVVPVEVLQVEPVRALQALLRLQVTARSVLGGLVLHTGGLRVDHGWLRVLGGGCAGLLDVAEMNRMGELGAGGELPGALIVAVDVLGGQFAINGGALPGESGEICFLGTDSLRWQPIGGGHSAFVSWVLRGGLTEFYGDVRWPGWVDEVEDLSLDQGLSLYPPLWSVEGRSNVAGTSRAICPVAELTALHLETVAQLGDPA